MPDRYYHITLTLYVYEKLMFHFLNFLKLYKAYIDLYCPAFSTLEQRLQTFHVPL